MLQLLKVEWLKVKNYRTFWVLSILYLVSLLGANYISYRMWRLAPTNNELSKSVLGSLFTFPDIWHMVSYISSFLMFILGLLIIISLTNEYSYKTIRQNIIDGWSRKEFILAKIAVTFILALAASIAVFFTALLFGLFENPGTFTLRKIEFVGYFFIQALSYTSAALLFSLLFKRSGLTIGVFFLYTLILENMLVAFLNYSTDNLGRYLPLETSDNLIRIPFGKTIINQFLASYDTTALLAMSAVYLALFYFISYKKLQADDL